MHGLVVSCVGPRQGESLLLTYKGVWLCLQTCYSLFKEKWLGRDASSSFGRGVALFKELLPADNLLPPSDYMMRKVLGYANPFADCCMQAPLLRQIWRSNLVSAGCRIQMSASITCAPAVNTLGHQPHASSGRSMQMTSALPALSS